MRDRQHSHSAAEVHADVLRIPSMARISDGISSFAGQRGTHEDDQLPLQSWGQRTAQTQ